MELEGPIFEPLKNVQLFRRLRLDPELRTVVWPNGADLAPLLWPWPPRGGKKRGVSRAPVVVID